MSQPDHIWPQRDQDVSIRSGRSDELKAAAILAVVCIHADLPDAEMLRFCVPIFIGIWAFHYERGLEWRADAWLYAKHRFLRLLPPYAFWTALYLCLDFRQDRWAATPIHTLLGGSFGGYGWAGQYFFIILFQLTWILPALRRWAFGPVLVPIVVAGLLLNVFADHVLFRNSIVARLGDRLFIYWIPYMFIGIALARGLPTRAWLIGFAFFLVATPYEMAYLLRIHGSVSPYLLASVSLGAASILLSFGPCSMPRNAKNSRFVESIRYLGRNSMPIFLSNPLMLGLLRKFIVPIASEPGKFLWLL